MVNFISSSNNLTDFTWFNKGGKEISLSSNTPGSVIFKRTKDNQFSVSARSAMFDNKPMALHFGKKIDSLINYSDEEEVGINKGQDYDVNNSISNLENYNPYIRLKGEYIYDAWFNDVQTISVLSDPRYKYNSPTLFSIKI